jgi:hypothetical protein
MDDEREKKFLWVFPFTKMMNEPGCRNLTIFSRFFSFALVTFDGQHLATCLGSLDASAREANFKFVFLNFFFSKNG